MFFANSMSDVRFILSKTCYLQYHAIPKVFLELTIVDPDISDKMLVDELEISAPECLHRCWGTLHWQVSLDGRNDCIPSTHRLRNQRRTLAQCFYWGLLTLDEPSQPGIHICVEKDALGMFPKVLIIWFKRIYNLNTIFLIKTVIKKSLSITKIE